ncbi:unnamed protein product [Didymodactylos carnosus]|uniref:Protein translocase subunit SecA n=1 Tax=Didymodactylos carnosus TaxID=1234261 RepID=A0A8S2N5L5_9BILA|nr:unnamed protein product [Didymodactylos carnosus]CAF3987625.1 unnamed protein product [Didymodactylos carnosus]
MGPDAVHTLNTVCERQSLSFEDFRCTLKAFWIKKFLPEMINDHGMEAITRNSHHKNHFLQCNIRIVQLFITLIPKPYESSSLLKLFDYFTDEKNLLSVEAIETFLSKNTGKTTDICLNQLCILICVKHIRKQIFIPSRIRSNLSYCIESLLSTWSLNDLCELMSLVHNTDDIKHLNSVLTIIVEFGLIFDRTIFNFIQRSVSSSEWPRIVHSYAIQVSLPSQSKMLELNDLFDHIINLTYTQMNAADKAKRKQELSNQYDCLSMMLNHFSSMDTNKLKDQLKLIPSSDFYSLVAFVIRVSDVVSQKPTRSVQKLSILLALDSSNASARILQINTGEGKTRLLSVLAVIISLRGFKVDVITSSKELAKIQAEKLKSFYELFNLKVACNADLSSQNYLYGRLRKKGISAQIFKMLGVFQPVYECDVIYGSADDFEAHILQDEFNDTSVRCDRRCEFALVDEVDNLMIDGREQLLHLSTPVPSIFYLLPIQAFIWNLILNLDENVQKIDGQWYKICQDEKENIVREPLNESLMDFAEKTFLPVFESVVHLEDIAPEKAAQKLIIPKHLHKVTSAQLSLWIRSAIYAKFEMKEGYDYLLKNHKIIYVDVKNTGVLHDTMRWSDGLHFFLEMKHGCSIQSEHIITNFISHVTFFRRYLDKLIGLTGTIGSEAAQSVFRKVYSANCIIIPCERRHYELRPYFTNNIEQWLHYIADNVEEKMKRNRAALIITKYIEEARTIAGFLRLSFPNRVKLYTENDEQNVVRESLEAGYVIVATNLAGRGADILVTEEVEHNGGLHVCITFLPDNDRVELQNQGRTSRCGHQGTSQFIINTSKESNDNCQTWLDEREKLEKMRYFRELIEEENMNQAIKAVEKTIEKDQIFQQFTSLQKTIIQCFPDHSQDIAKDALRERFGRWLIESSSKTNHELQQFFDQFKTTCQNDPQNTLIDNPVYYVQMANTLLKEQKNVDEAINYLNKAIQMDPYCAASAFYSRAYARALQYKKTGDTNQLKDSISNFEEARRIIKEILDPTILLFPVATTDSPLHEFLVHLKSLYGILLNSINVAIGRSCDEDIKNLEEQLNNEMNSEQRKQLEEKLNCFKNNRNQIENGILGTTLNTKSVIKIQRMTLMESLPLSENKDLYKKEIEEFERNGFIGIIIFNEQKPIEWWSVISVGLLGLSQILVGIFVAVLSTGAAAGVGLSLLQEGISDLITCVKDGILNRSFSWSKWGTQKVYSLVITIIFTGFSALKAAMRTVGSAATTVRNAINYGIKELYTKTFQEGIQIGGKMLALQSIKRAAVEVALSLADYALSETIPPSIQTTIQKILAEEIQLKFKNHKNLHRLMTCDGKQRNRFYANQLKDYIFSQLNEESLKAKCLAVGTVLLKAASFHSGIATRSASIIQSLTPIIEKAYIVIGLIDTEANRLGQLDEVQDIVDQTNDQQQQGLFYLYYRDSNVTQAKNDQISLTIEEFCSDITDQMSKIICQYLQASIVRPLISSGMDQVFSGFNQNLNNQLDLFIKKRTVLDHQIFHQSEIHGNVNEETVAIAQVEINNVGLGAAGQIHHIGYISQAMNRRILIYDERGRVEHVVGLDTSQPAIEIVYHPSNQPNRADHWTTVHEENTEQIRIYNCLFDMISAQTECDSTQIREKTVQAMEGNRSKLAAAMHDLQFLRQTYRDHLFFVENCRSQTE